MYTLSDVTKRPSNNDNEVDFDIDDLNDLNDPDLSIDDISTENDTEKTGNGENNTPPEEGLM
jgi:hypothetical protein